MWQPIETAPKDGQLLLYFPSHDGCIEGWWWFGREGMDEDGWETIIGFIGDPTHWMPAPEPPTVNDGSSPPQE